VTRALATCDAQLQAIATYRKEMLGRLGRRTAAPLWQLDRSGKGLGSVADRLREAAGTESHELRGFLSSRGPLALGGGFACFGVLVALFRTARRRSLRWEAGELGEAAQVFSRPYASALLLAVFCQRFLFHGTPLVYDQVLLVLACVAALRLAWVLLDRSLRSLLVATAISFLWDQLRELVSPIPLLEQLLFVSQMLAGAGFLATLLPRARLERLGGTGAPASRKQLFSVLIRAMLVALAVAAVAGATGYLELAYLVGEGALFALYLGLVLYALRSAADGLVSFVLHVWPLVRLRMVERHRGLIQARLTRAIGVAAFLTWVAGTLSRVGVLQPLVAAVRATLALPLTPATVGITLGDVVAFGLTLWAAFGVSRFVRFALEEDVYHRLRLSHGLPYAVSSLAHYSILLVGFLLAVLSLGLDVNRFTLLAGAFGVGVGFGLQNVVNNFVSGLILLFERPIQVGDAVQLGELTGEVTRIGIRSSTVRTWEGAEVILPNASLIQEPVTNWTLSDRMRRIDISIGAAYGSDPERVLSVLLEVAKQERRVLASPEPVPLFVGFGDSSLDFQLRAWTDDPQWPLVRSDLSIAVYRAFRANGIEIPFPQQDVHLQVDKG
jgi:small-conductance mechanosensitive channel